MEKLQYVTKKHTYNQQHKHTHCYFVRHSLQSEQNSHALHPLSLTCYKTEKKRKKRQNTCNINTIV